MGKSNTKNNNENGKSRCDDITTTSATTKEIIDTPGPRDDVEVVEHSKDPPQSNDSPTKTTGTPLKLSYAEVTQNTASINMQQKSTFLVLKENIDNAKVSDTMIFRMRRR